MSRCHIGITSFWCHLGSPLGMKIPRDSLYLIPLCFLWHLGTNYFKRQLRSSLELSRWRVGINSIWRQLGNPLGFAIPGYSFSGISPFSPPVGVYYSYSFVWNYIFPRWGFTILLLSWGTKCILCKIKVGIIFLIMKWNSSWKNICTEILLSKTWWEQKTVIFQQLKAMRGRLLRKCLLLY